MSAFVFVYRCGNYQRIRLHLQMVSKRRYLSFWDLCRCCLDCSWVSSTSCKYCPSHLNPKSIRNCPYMSIFSWMYKPYTFWEPLPSNKRVHINIFWVPKIPMKIIKIRSKNWSVQKKCWFSQTNPPPPKRLYTHENVDIYGRLLKKIANRVISPLNNQMVTPVAGSINVDWSCHK